MTTARNAGRINVWPSTVIARAADTAESKVLGRMTVWPTHSEALQNREYPDVEEGGYVGPLDIVPGAVVAYGNRALSAAMRGQPLYRLRRDSDDEEMTFNSDAVTGDAPIADILAWLGAATGLLKTWFDQSGNGVNLTALADANQAPWSATIVNGNPGFGTFPAADIAQFASETTFCNIPAAATMSIVGKNSFLFLTGDAPDFNYINLIVQDDNTYLDNYDGTNEAGGRFALSETDAFHIYSAAWQFGSASLTIDGSAVTETASFDAGIPLSTTVCVRVAIGSDESDLSNTGIAETIYWGSIVSGGNRAAVDQNQSIACDIPLA